MRSFIFCTQPQILLGKSNQGECSGQNMWHAWERRGKFIRSWWESQKERDDLEDLGVRGRMESYWVLGRLARGVEWIQLAQDRDRCRAIVNTVMNLRVLAIRSC
jgi:hypothetical protein